MPAELLIQVASDELGVEEQRPFVTKYQPNSDWFVLEVDEDALSKGHLASFWETVRNIAFQIRPGCRSTWIVDGSADWSAVVVEVELYVVLATSGVID